MVRLLHIGIEAGNNKWIAAELKRRTIYAEIKPNESDHRIKKLFDDHKPECIFLQVQSEGVIGIDLIKYMAQSCVIINWCGDVRDPIPSWYYEFDQFCITAFSNMRDVDELECEFLQIGIDPKIYFAAKEQKEHDIVFFANRSLGFPLSGFRIETVDYLRQIYKHRFKLFGSWPMANGNFNSDQHEEAKQYRKSKIAISISHFNIGRYFSDRLIRAMGCGVFTLSHHYEGIENDFEVGKHLDTFKTLEELRQKIDYYLDHDAKRISIASAGCIHVHENFTTRNMVNDILKIYEKNKSK